MHLGYLAMFIDIADGHNLGSGWGRLLATKN